jgi:SAM-dependent methyltransferase
MTEQPADLDRLPRRLGRYSTVWHHRLMLAAGGIYLTPTSRVLDFGCGAGRTVYEYRDSGFDAYGFDIANDVELRQPEDAALFRFATTATSGNVADYRLTGSDYRIGFDDASFDFVFSNSVFEHVQDHGLALREVARVLSPGGLSIHIFPARYSLIEPHLYVPLGGVIRHVLWYRLWAALGVRNRFQHEMSATEVAMANLRYSQTGINHPPVETLLEIAHRHFAEAKLAPELWTIGSLRHPLVRIPMLGWIYSRFDTVVLWLKK